MHCKNIKFCVHIANYQKPVFLTPRHLDSCMIKNGVNLKKKKQIKEIKCRENRRKEKDRECNFLLR